MKAIKPLTEMQLRTWMQDLRSPYYCCEKCGALHLNPHPFTGQGVLLSVDVMDGYLTYTAIAGILTDAIDPFASLLPELNSIYTGLKIFMELEGTLGSQLTIQAVLPVHVGINFAQFTGFIHHAESDVAAVLNELIVNKHLTGCFKNSTLSSDSMHLHSASTAS